MIRKIIWRLSYLRSIITMSSFIFIVLVFVPLPLAAIRSIPRPTGKIFPSGTTGIENHDFIFKVAVLKAPITSCTIKFGYSKIVLDREHPQDVNVSYIDNWEKGECGVYFRPLTKARTGNWDLTVVSGNGTKENYYAYVRADEEILYWPHWQSKKIVIGQELSVNCSDSNTKYAKLYDPRGKLVMEGWNAHFHVKRARYKDNGTWKCIKVEYGISEKTYDIDVQGEHNRT